MTTSRKYVLVPESLKASDLHFAQGDGEGGASKFMGYEDSCEKK